MGIFEWATGFEWAVWEIGAVVTALGLVLLRTWLKAPFSRTVPGLTRTMLALANFGRRIGEKFGRSKRPASDNRFRFVLCWLDGDRYGRNTATVNDAFQEVSGVELARSASIVKAKGAGDDWRPAMREKANAILREQRGDLAVVGRVEKPGEKLSLWFVPREGDGTLGRAEQQFALNGVSLVEGFRETLHEQIAAVALSTVAPLASDEARGRILEDGLKQVVEKLGILLDSGEIAAPSHRAGLRVAHGRALFALGERKSKTALFEEAVASYREALKEYTSKNAPLNWAAAQNNLGMALANIGERESRTERLEEAVVAFRKALQEYTSENTPLNWAATQNNLGATLVSIGGRESGTEKLEEGIAAFCKVLTECTRENTPLDWAGTQYNLGTALACIGERESGTAHLEKAATAYDNALTIFDPAQTPVDWKAAHSALAKVRAIIRQRSEGPR